MISTTRWYREHDFIIFFATAWVVLMVVAAVLAPIMWLS